MKKNKEAIFEKLWNLIPVKTRLNMPFGIYEKIKDMHKQEIIDSNNAGYKNASLYFDGKKWKYQCAEQYYNETFNNDDK